MQQSLKIVGLEPYFAGRITTATEVSHGKPAPDLFLLAAAKQNVEPGNCLVIEDSLVGVEAGLAAGMQVWRFTGGSHLAGRALAQDADVKAHRQFSAFKQLFQLAPELQKGD